MNNHSAGRSIVPAWVKALDRHELHALALKLRRDFVDGELSDRQDWLLDRCFAELEYRHQHPEKYASCWCDVCVASWDDACPILEEFLPEASQGPF